MCWGASILSNADVDLRQARRLFDRADSGCILRGVWVSDAEERIEVRAAVARGEQQNIQETYHVTRVKGDHKPCLSGQAE